jgi:hypothetical protein
VSIRPRERLHRWTVHVLAAARGIYQRSGFQLVSEEPIQAFGHDLVDQTWRLDL